MGMKNGEELYCLIFVTVLILVYMYLYIFHGKLFKIMYCVRGCRRLYNYHPGVLCYSAH